MPATKQSTIEQFFQRYVKAFEQQDMIATKACYQLPCTLHTPDKAILISNQGEFDSEFADIFTVLSHANIVTFKTLKASYSVISAELILACIDWQFVDSNAQVFTDFSAFYHLSLFDEQWKIVNVVSQELSQSISLSIPFNIIS
jgi:hypothetical protein